MLPVPHTPLRTLFFSKSLLTGPQAQRSLMPKKSFFSLNYPLEIKVRIVILPVFSFLGADRPHRYSLPLEDQRKHVITPK